MTEEQYQVHRPPASRLQVQLTADMYKDRPFRLLDLPPELWSRICACAVVGAQPIVLCESYQDPMLLRLADDACDAAKQPAITQTCKTLRSEALPLFYGKNIVILVDTWENIDEPVLRWLDAIGATNRRLLRLYVASNEHECGEPYFGEDAKLAKYGALFLSVLLDEWKHAHFSMVHKVTLVD